ncbi:porin [Marinomonas ostreistagni]|uniref:porin n=1 Tax=Marinomonas ostreistagni TaxID=359209 RepID=UPI00194E7895|nr:porin [Marinomonas ostreistagni]MBM6549822.1 porin [Marinomonas ostreistagni]
MPAQNLTRFMALALCTATFAGTNSSFAASLEDSVSVSGFGRVVGGYLNTDQAEFRGYSDHINLDPKSLIGLQVHAQANDYLSVTAQGVLRANDTQDSELDWLYATIQPEDNLSIKVGKLRTPFFMLSDVIDVGYAYHWISPPEQMYSAYLFPTFEGIDATWGYFSNGFDTSFEAYIGQHEGDITLNNRTTDYDVDTLGGLIASTRYGNVQLRASFHQGDVDIALSELDLLAGSVSRFNSFPKTVDALSTQSVINVTQLGIRYDDLNYFAAAEWVNINPDVQTFIPEIDTYYLTGGYIFDDITLHLTYAESDLSYDDFPNEVASALANMNPLDPRYQGLAGINYGLNQIESSRSSDSLKSWTLGVRWDVQPKLAVKGEVTWLRGDRNESAMFNSIDDDFDRTTELYQVGVEWIF